jgi:hypothetical protein
LETLVIFRIKIINSKHQTLNSKQITNSKSQILNLAYRQAGKHQFSKLQIQNKNPIILLLQEITRGLENLNFEFVIYLPAGRQGEKTE